MLSLLGQKPGQIFSATGWRNCWGAGQGPRSIDVQVTRFAQKREGFKESPLFADGARQRLYAADRIILTPITNKELENAFTRHFRKKVEDTLRYLKIIRILPRTLFFGRCFRWIFIPLIVVQVVSPKLRLPLFDGTWGRVGKHGCLPI